MNNEYYCPQLLRPLFQSFVRTDRRTQPKNNPAHAYICRVKIVHVTHNSRKLLIQAHKCAMSDQGLLPDTYTYMIELKVPSFSDLYLLVSVAVEPQSWKAVKYLWL